MKKLILILLLSASFAGCERYQHIQGSDEEGIVQDRFTGTLYLVEGSEMTEIKKAPANTETDAHTTGSVVTVLVMGGVAVLIGWQLWRACKVVA